MTLDRVAEALAGRVWRFETADGGFVHLPFVRLLPDGRVAADPHPSLVAWRLIDGEIAFVDVQGATPLRFDPAPLSAPGPPALAGRSLWDDSRNTLVEISLDLPQAAAPIPPLLRIGAPTGNRHLMVLRANEHSLHPHWPRTPAEPSTWDLCLSWYGAGEPPLDDGAAQFVSVQRTLRKFQALHQLFAPGSPLWAYDYIALPDDDLAMDLATVNRLFEHVRRYRLELAQPALWHDSVINYPQTRRREDWTVRYVNFVELMMPVFSVAALRACLPTFSANASGFGVDYAWARLIDPSPSAIGIVDAAPVRHTRPTGINYDLDAARAEGWDVARRFGGRDYLRMRELGGVRAEPDTL